MKNIEQLLNKENWIKYLELADEGGITNHGIAQDIVKKIQEAITVTPCCTELPNCYSTELDKIEQLQQTQTSTRHQLDVLRVFANKLGLYDACDYLK